MRARRRLWGALLAVSTLVAITACTDDAPSRGAASSVAADDGKEVVLVTYDAFALPDAAAATFTDRTGAKIKVVASGDAGAMLSKALLSAGAPEGDVLFGVDNTLATRVTDEDLLSPYSPPGTTGVPDPLKLSGKPGRLLTPIDSGDVCINVDATWFAQHGLAPPTTLDDLADPRYRDLLVVQSPVTSSPGLAFLIGTVQRYGADGWKDYWTRLQANGVLVRPSWDDSYSTDYTVSGGDRPLVVSYASSPPAEVVFSEGAVTQPRSTVMADSCVAQVEYAGVLKGAAHPALARELVDFMLSPAWQSALPLSNFVFPAVDGTPLPPEFQQWAVQPASPRTLSATEIGSKREAWIEQWRDIME